MEKGGGGSIDKFSKFVIYYFNNILEDNLKIARTDRFKKAWEKLTKGEKTLARKAITHLASDIRYPALRAKKIKGVEGIWEARLSLSLRITFQIMGSTVLLRNIGRHDETIGHP